MLEQQYHICRQCHGTGKKLALKKIDRDQTPVVYYASTTIEKFYFETCDDCSGSGKIQY
jgi:DnaJ-class molecular chaperone